MKAPRALALTLPLVLALAGDRVSFAGETAAPAEQRFDAALAELERSLDAAIATASAGDARGASLAIGDAYFDVFEARGIEAAIAAIDAGEKARLEARFGEMRAVAGSAGGVDAAALHAIARDIVGSSRRAVAPHPWGEGFSIFLQSLLILLREGIEAILVVSALAAYLVKIGHGAKTKVLYANAAAALLASVVLAAAIFWILGGSGAPSEIIEGVSMLLAAGVLFYVSYWLLSHAQASRWDRFIKDKAMSAVTRGSMFALGTTAFLAVFREGAETILFYNALLASGGREQPGSVAAGVAAASVGLAIAFVAMKWLGMKLPLRPFFRITGGMLYVLAFVFAGRGVVELQAGQLLGATPVPGFPQVPALGIFPYVESLAAQAALLLAALVALVVTLLPGRPAGPGKRAAVTAATILALLLAGADARAQGKAPFREYPIGDEQIVSAMKVAAVYLPPVPVEGEEILPETGKERIHLECDIHALKGHANGFGIGEWIPYLTVKYEITHKGSGQKVEGEFMPMVAKDGPHYGATVRMLGKGDYHLAYRIKNPGAKGFGRHSDPVTGVGEWFADFSVEWDFAYEGAPVAEMPK